MTRRNSRAILFLATAAMCALLPLPAAADSAALRVGCPGQNNGNAPTAVQESAMLCLVNQARKQRGLSPLAAPESLARAAARKSGDILRCDEFSHEACGRDFTYWMSRMGYARGTCWQAGENIAYASGSYAPPRSIFKLWMNSAGHRRNILGPYEDIGIGLQVGELEGVSRAHVWTQEFGSRC